MNLDDPRLGSLLDGGCLCAGGVGLVLFACDEGVRRNGGRAGAAQGPQRFVGLARRAGALRNAELGLDLSAVRVAAPEPGSELPLLAASLEQAHALLEARVARVLAAGAVPFVVGGGNDQSYPNARAWLAQNTGSNNSKRRLGVVNVDAHLDVRPLKDGLAHSGSPFRQLLEDPRFGPASSSFVEFAAQGAQCSAQHAAWLVERGVRIVWLTEVRRKGALAAFEEVLQTLAQKNDDVFVSFDLDAVAGCDAPGVSAPGVVGLTADEALQICFAAGAHPQVAMFDLSEYNPLAEPGCEESGIAPGYRTGKLVAAMFYHFLLGFSTRKKDAEVVS